MDRPPRGRALHGRRAELVRLGPLGRHPGRPDAPGRARRRRRATGTSRSRAIQPVADGRDPPALAHRRRRRAEPGAAEDPARASWATTGSARPSRRPRSWPRVGPGSPDGEPAVAVQPYGRGRTMAMATGDHPPVRPASSRQSWGEGDARYYKKFWRNAVYWLTENSSIGRRRLLAETDKRLYRPGRADRPPGPDLRRERRADARLPRGRLGRAEVGRRRHLRQLPAPPPAAGPTAGRRPGPLLPWGEEFDLSKLAADKSYTATLPIADGKSLPTGVVADAGAPDRADGLREQHPGRQHGARRPDPRRPLRAAEPAARPRPPEADRRRLRRLGPRDGRATSPRCSAACPSPSARPRSRRCPPGAAGGCSPP